MSKSQKLFIFFIIAVALAGLLQTSGTLRPWGIVPNLTLAVLAVAAFFIESIIPFLFLLIISSITLRFEGGMSITLFVFLGIALALFWVRGRILLPGRSTTLVLIIGGTLLLYLVLDPRFIVQFPAIVFWEFVYNVIVGAALFWVANGIYAKGA